MQRVIDLIIAVYRYALWLILLAFIIFGLLFTVRYRAMIRNQSKVMAFTDSIAAYIQKSGGFVLKEGQTKQDFYRELADANSVTSMVCPESQECMVEVEKEEGTGGEHGRSTIYRVTTRYFLVAPKFPGTSGTSSTAYLKRNTRPVVSRAYVTEYRNY